FSDKKCHCDDCEQRPFIRCSWCDEVLCFDHFFHEYHVMKCVKSPYLNPESYSHAPGRANSGEEPTTSSELVTPSGDEPGSITHNQQKIAPNQRERSTSNKRGRGSQQKVLATASAVPSSQLHQELNISNITRGNQQKRRGRPPGSKNKLK
ncbi:unnamed protein product, partial [Allacma fusca]